MRQWLTPRQVLARMRAGDLPTVGCWDVAARWEDGTIASSRVMQELVKRGLVQRPKHTSIYAKWTLSSEPE